MMLTSGEPITHCVLTKLFYKYGRFCYFPHMKITVKTMLYFHQCFPLIEPQRFCYLCRSKSAEH